MEVIDRSNDWISLETSDTISYRVSLISASQAKSIKQYLKPILFEHAGMNHLV